MRHIIEAGTDGGSLVLFDPGALPADYDAKRRDPGEVLDRLHAAGTLFRINTEGDGGYLLHAHVDEDLPDDVRPSGRDPAVVEALPVPSGRLYFTGAEYVFREDDARLARYPHMGGRIDLAPGTYRLTLYRTAFPDGADDALFRRRASPAGVRLHAALNGLAAFTVFSVFVALVALFAVTWRAWLVTAVPVIAAEVALLVALRRLPAFRAADAIWDEVQREFPSYVAVLEQRWRRVDVV